MTRLLILGGGFGGVETARRLERLLRGRDDVEVTLVSRDNFFLFTPMLHEVAASDVDITHIVSPLRALLPRTNVIVGDLRDIDLPGRRVRVTHGADGHGHEIEFDQLLITLGAVTNFNGVPGLAEHALTMKTLGDAIHLRNHVISLLEEASTECGPADGRRLSIVVAGGGFAGVETIAALNDFVREALVFYPRLRQQDVRMVLVHSGTHILPELGDDLGAYAARKLTARGVEIVTGERVQRVDRDGVTLADGRRIASRVVVWTAGTSPHPLLAALPCQRDHGRLVVEATLAAPGWPGVWALGDCANVPDVRSGRPHPPTAQHALREARTVASNMVAAIDGRRPRPFTFRTIGQLAAIGRRTGVARIFGVKFSGFVAWWLWRTVYLSKLPRLEKKLRVAIDWTLDLVFAKDFVQFLTVREPRESA
jgi:NADH:ubiquinone reductase (H+-translocating)